MTSSPATVGWTTPFRIDPARLYPVRAAVLFPIEENHRCARAIGLLRGSRPDDRRRTLQAVGELMYHSHAGYSAMGLGCPETDAMVRAVRERGPDNGFYGGASERRRQRRYRRGAPGGGCLARTRNDWRPTRPWTASGRPR